MATAAAVARDTRSCFGTTVSGPVAAVVAPLEAGDGATVELIGGRDGGEARRVEDWSDEPVMTDEGDAPDERLASDAVSCGS